MPSRRRIRCPYCGHSYLLDELISPAPPLDTACPPDDSEDLEPDDTLPSVSWVWPVVVIVASTVGMAVVLATHKNMVAVLAYVVLIAAGSQAWLKSRRARR